MVGVGSRKIATLTEVEDGGDAARESQAGSAEHDGDALLRRPAGRVEAGGARGHLEAGGARAAAVSTARSSTLILISVHA